MTKGAYEVTVTITTDQFNILMTIDETMKEMAKLRLDLVQAQSKIRALELHEPQFCSAIGGKIYLHMSNAFNLSLTEDECRQIFEVCRRHK